MQFSDVKNLKILIQNFVSKSFYNFFSKKKKNKCNVTEERKEERER